MSFFKIFILLFLMLVATLAPCSAFAVPAGQVPTVQEIAGEMGQCFYCPVVENFLIASSEFLLNNQDTIGEGVALKLLGLGFVMWLFNHVLHNAIGLNAKPKDFLLGLVQRAFAVIIAASFLTAGVKELSSVTVEPIIEFSAAIGVELLAAENPSVTGGAKFCNPVIAIPVGGTTPGTVAGYEALQADGFFSNNVLISISCLLREMDANIMPGRVVGQSLLSYAFSDIASTMGLPPFFILFCGLMLTIPYFYLIIFVPYCLVDAILRLVLVGVLFPLFVVAWVFPATRDYSVKALNMVIASALELMIMSLGIGFCTASINKMAANIELKHYNYNGLLGFGSWHSDPDRVSLYDLLNTAVPSKIDVRDLSIELTGWNSPLLLKMFMISLLLCILVKKLKNFADGLANDSFIQINASDQLLRHFKDPLAMGTTVWNVTKNVATAPVNAYRSVQTGARRAKAGGYITKRAAVGAYHGSRAIARGANEMYDKASMYTRTNAYKSMQGAHRHASGLAARAKKRYQDYKDRFS
ncbi:MAG: type IV secretion system protein [Alphaproteobacteria bacterium]|nr:type IV secretion system protein [Alphaproteobacteria bacterium]